MEAIELLSLLGERYEDEHWPITELDPLSGVRYLIEKGNFTERSPVPEFGSESLVRSSSR
jgi:antitoxin component HigA of HigAB toxin-antitoxin module